MFSPGLTNNLDNLAREGIIDFDATSFVTGTKARYVGNPSWAQQPMPDMSDVDTKNLQQPNVDELISSDSIRQGEVSKNPLWKKVLFGVIAAGLLLGGVKFFKGKNLKNLISGLSNPFAGVGKAIKNGGKTLLNKLGNFGTSVKNTVKSGFSKVVNFVKSKKP